MTDPLHVRWFVSDEEVYRWEAVGTLVLAGSNNGPVLFDLIPEPDPDGDDAAEDRALASARALAAHIVGLHNAALGADRK